MSLLLGQITKRDESSGEGRGDLTPISPIGQGALDSHSKHGLILSTVVSVQHRVNVSVENPATVLRVYLHDLRGSLSKLSLRLADTYYIHKRWTSSLLPILPEGDGNTLRQVKSTKSKGGRRVVL